jgi:hypothetical protein
MPTYFSRLSSREMPLHLLASLSSHQVKKAAKVGKKMRVEGAPNGPPCKLAVGDCRSLRTASATRALSLIHRIMEKHFPACVFGIHFVARLPGTGLFGGVGLSSAKIPSYLGMFSSKSKHFAPTE